MRDLYCKTPMDLEIVEEIEKSRREARGVTAVAADGGGTGSAIYLQDSNGNITSSSTQITTTPPPAPIDALKISDRSEEWWSSVTPFALKTEVIRRRDENFKRTRELVTADGSDGWNLWTYEENVKLVSMVETYGHAWSIIKGEFPGRSLQQIHTHYWNALATTINAGKRLDDPSLQRCSRTSRIPWTKDETVELYKRVNEHWHTSKNIWVTLHKRYFPYRNPTELFNQWKKNDPMTVDGIWFPSERELLRKAVELFGPVNSIWSIKRLSAFSHRSMKSIRMQLNKLKSTAGAGFTRAEDQMLKTLAGPPSIQSNTARSDIMWRDIQTHFKGRSCKVLAQRWLHLIKRENDMKIQAEREAVFSSPKKTLNQMKSATIQKLLEVVNREIAALKSQRKVFDMESSSSSDSSTSSDKNNSDSISINASVSNASILINKDEDDSFKGGFHTLHANTMNWAFWQKISDEMNWSRIDCRDIYFGVTSTSFLEVPTLSPADRAIIVEQVDNSFQINWHDLSRRLNPLRDPPSLMRHVRANIGVWDLKLDEYLMKAVAVVARATMEELERVHEERMRAVDRDFIEVVRSPTPSEMASTDDMEMSPGSPLSKRRVREYESLANEWADKVNWNAVYTEMERLIKLDSLEGSSTATDSICSESVTDQTPKREKGKLHPSKDFAALLSLIGLERLPNRWKFLCKFQLQTGLYVLIPNAWKEELEMIKLAFQVDKAEYLRLEKERRLEEKRLSLEKKMLRKKAWDAKRREHHLELVAPPQSEPVQLEEKVSTAASAASASTPVGQA